MGFHCSKSLTQTKFIAPLLHLLQLKGFQKAFPSSRFHSEIDSRRPPLYQIPKHSSCMKDFTIEGRTQKRSQNFRMEKAISTGIKKNIPVAFENVFHRQVLFVYEPISFAMEAYWL
ncbi:unnamed protein product [Albugo candida]|uniref:Uncharacterized protein n=1 Tax=Albugo candida TaxID=65357 RepID=A0A024GNB1_9STRA|nr:unnamed protein product [Albugo candida]|eukprot:CCI48368.1 unnamed protein product [Albugo candida]